MKIYHKSGIEALDIVPLDNSIHVQELKADDFDYIDLYFNEETYKQLERGCYLTYENKRYILESTSKPTINPETGGFEYGLRFLSLVNYYLKYYIFWFYPTHSQRKETNWTYTGHCRDLITMFCGYVEDTFNIQILVGSMPVDADIRTIDFQGLTLLQSLNAIAEAFDTDWWFVKDINTGTDVINISTAAHGNGVILEYDKEIHNIEESNTDTDIYTRIYAYGSAKNIPSNYYPVEQVNYVTTANRLRLPQGIEYIQELNADVDNLKEGVVIFEDVFAGFIGTVDKAGERLFGNGKGYYYIAMNDIIYHDSFAIETPLIHFTSGQLNGRAFEFVHEYVGGSVNAHYFGLIPNDNEPNIPKINGVEAGLGDSFTFLNVDILAFGDENHLPLMLTAEQELYSKALNFFNSQGSEFVYNLDMRSIYCREKDIFLKVGERVNLVSPAINENGLHVMRVEYPLYDKYQATYTVGDKDRYSILLKGSHKKGNVIYIANSTAINNQYVMNNGGGGSGQGHSRLHSMTSPLDHAPVEEQDRGKIAVANEVTGAWEMRRKEYTHIQNEPSDEWLVVHYLKKKPSVTCVDNYERVWQGEIEYIDENTLKIKFTAGFSGKAYCN